jgi:N-alpha-acetyltransferase 15/16, NatA auxiliary subunit
MFIDQGIAHTPTHIELYLIKGQILQKAGDWIRGQELYEEGRMLDQADRALNALSAKQMLKVNMTEEGEACMNIFFKACGYETGVHEVQTMWFESMSAKAYYRKKDWRNALNEFHWIDKHIEQMINGQYDYYCYAIRKYSLKAFEE